MENSSQYIEKYGYALFIQTGEETYDTETFETSTTFKKIDNSTILSINLTSSVNSGTDLTFGSVCSSCIEVIFWSPNQTSNELPIKAGTRLIFAKTVDVVYGYGSTPPSVSRSGNYMFTCERPTILSENTYKVIGYDSVASLSKSADIFIDDLYSQTSTYTLLDFITNITNEYGFKFIYDNYLENNLLNASVKIAKPKMSNTTYRQLLQYACAIGGISIALSTEQIDGIGGFALNDFEEEVTISYVPKFKEVWPGKGNTIVLTKDLLRSITFEDYEVIPCDSIYITNSDNDVLIGSNTNTYVFGSNPLLRGMTEATLLEIGNNLLAKLKTTKSYTPGTVTIADETVGQWQYGGYINDILAGDMCSIAKPPYGENDFINFYITEISIKSDDLLTLKSTGYESRNSVEANNETQETNASQNAINSSVTTSVGTATVDTVGVVKADGVTTTISSDGTISAITTGSSDGWTIEVVDSLPEDGKANVLYLVLYNP